MANKTIQALKIAASWTPDEATADKMMNAIDNADILGARLAGGRLSIKHAVATDYSDPTHSARVSKRIFEMKAALGERGELHSFTVTAGAVPVEAAEFLPDDQLEETDE